jgi:purine-binding chemotaxis protein CheW
MNESAEQTHQEFLIFDLEGVRYGLPVAEVREIVRAVLPVPLPGAPGVVEGVINLRGKVVPVLDLRQRFRLRARPIEYTDHLVIARAGGRLVALRVDRVVDLVRVAAGDVEDVAATGSGEPAARVARLPGDLVVIQDLAALLSQAETSALNHVLPVEGGPP